MLAAALLPVHGTSARSRPGSTAQHHACTVAMLPMRQYSNNSAQPKRRGAYLASSGLAARTRHVRKEQARQHDAAPRMHSSGLALRSPARMRRLFQHPQKRGHAARRENARTHLGKRFARRNECRDRLLPQNRGEHDEAFHARDRLCRAAALRHPSHELLEGVAHKLGERVAGLAADKSGERLA